MNLLKLDNAQYKTLKENYLKAKNDNKPFFVLWEQNIDTNYAKYLIEAIENHRVNTGQSIIKNPEYKQSHLCPDGTTYTWNSRKEKPLACVRCKNRLDLNRKTKVKQ